MDDLERRFALARPKGLTRDAPLSDRAEADLVSILGDSPKRDRRAAADGRWRWPAAALAAAAALSVLAVVNIGQVPVAAAVPPALEFVPLAAADHEVLAELSVNAREQAALPSTAIRYESWSVTIVPGSDTSELFVQPEEVTLLRDSRDAGEITVRAGGLRWGAPADGQRSAEPGELLRRSTYQAGEFPRLFPADEPPVNAAEMRVYLQQSLGLDATATAGDYFNGVRDLRNEWNLSGAQTAAVIEMLAVMPGVQVAGTTQDRLGRTGVALVTTSRSGGAFRDVLIVDADTGALLTSEVDYLGGLPEITLPFPTVLTYIAWKDTPPE